MLRSLEIVSAHRIMPRMAPIAQHLARARWLCDKGADDEALNVLCDCILVDPSNLEIYTILMPLSRRNAQRNAHKTGLALLAHRIRMALQRFRLI